MQRCDGGEVRMLKADEGEGELENNEEEEQGGETGGFPGVAGGEGESTMRTRMVAGTRKAPLMPWRAEKVS
jgi:hypothetical protein